MNFRFKARLSASLLVGLLLLIAGVSCPAQQTATHGTLQVKFPSADWSETEAPAELRAFFEGGRSPAKLVMHAVSPSAQARFHITRLDYPATTNMADTVVAGYIDGTRKRCARQAAGKVTETMGEANGFPVKTFEAVAPGDLFFEIQVILCADHLYSVEINSPTASSEEAKRCLEGVSLVGEKPLSSFLVAGAAKVSADQGGTMRAYQMGRVAGYAVASVMFAVLGATVIMLLLRKQSKAASIAQTPPKPPSPGSIATKPPPIIPSETKPGPGN